MVTCLQTTQHKTNQKSKTHANLLIISLSLQTRQVVSFAYLWIDELKLVVGNLTQVRCLTLKHSWLAFLPLSVVTHTPLFLSSNLHR